MATTEISDKKELQGLVDRLTKETTFERPSVEALVHIFKTFSDGADKLDRQKFRDFLHSELCMTDDLLMDRVFRALDLDSDNYLSKEEFVCGLKVLLKPHNIDERIEYCFCAYDLNGDGLISREEMFQLLKNSLVKQPTEEDPDEGIKELVEMLIKIFDSTKQDPKEKGNGKFSYKDYCNCVKEDILLLEIFGQLLPTDKVISDFLSKIGDDSMSDSSKGRKH